MVAPMGAFLLASSQLRPRRGYGRGPGRGRHAHVPYKHIDGDYRLGRWVVKQRNRAGQLTLERRARLEALPGWVWNTKDAAWEQSFTTSKSSRGA